MTRRLARYLTGSVLGVLWMGGVAAAASPGAPAASQAAVPVSAASALAAAPRPLEGYVVLKLSELPTAARQGTDNAPDSSAAWTALLSAWAWPLCALAGLAMLLRAPAVKLLLERLPRHVTQINVAGMEFKLSAGAQAAMADLEKLIGQVPETYRDWIAASNVSSQFQLLVARLKTHMTTDSPAFGERLQEQDYNRLRLTLHVPDVILEHSLRQLVDYAGSDRGKAGRVFSMRIGIIGKAWRMEQSQFVSHNTYNEDQLVEIWGMTRPEARDTSRPRRQHLAVLIRSPQGLPLGLLYSDSEEPTALFDPTRMRGHTEAQMFSNLAQAIQDISDACGLTASLVELDTQRRRIRPLDPYRATGQRH